MKKKLSGLIGIVLVALALSSQITPFEVKASTEIEYVMATDSDEYVGIPFLSGRITSFDVGANTEIEYTMATDSDFSKRSDGSFKYIGSDEYVEIPHKINGVNVTSYYNMFMGSSVKGVKSTNKNVTNMRYMFYDNKATNLDLSNLDTSNVTNMSNMFYNSNSTSLDVSNFDTSKVTNMSNMFYNSKSTSLDLSSFDTSNVTNMNRMFYHSQATELDVSSFDTSNVTDMDWMFYKNQATELDLSSFDTSGITRMYNMFEGSQATKLDLSSFDTSNVTTMVNMFSGSQATTLDLSSFDTSSVTRMDGMFYNSQATTLDLSSFDTSSVTSMNGMFSRSQATKLDLSSFDISNVTNMYQMFYLSQATSLDLSNFDTSNVRNMYQMFRDSRAKELDLSSFDTSNVTNMFQMFYHSRAAELDLSNFDTSNVTNMISMFRDSQATKLDLSSFDTSNVTNMSHMFYNSQTTELDLSHFDTSSVTDMTYMFRNSQATKLDLSSFDTSNVTNMTSMFSDTRATELDLSSFDTSNVTNMSGMFNGSQATKLDLSSFDTSNVTNMYQMFYYSQATKLDLSSFDTSNVTNMYQMFYYSRAAELDLSNFDTSSVTNMYGMFWNIRAATLDLSGFDMSNVKNTDRMFSGARSTIGYARTEQGVDILNTISKPAGLMFFVYRDPNISVTPDGNHNWSKEHIVSLNAEGYDPRKPIQIAWSPNKSNQGLDWVDVKSGSNTYEIPLVHLENIVGGDLNGNLYLHVRMTDLTESPFYYVSDNVFAFDSEGPIINLSQDGGSDYAENHSTTITASDNGSGLNEAQYQWTTDTTFPTSGTWVTVTDGTITTTPVSSGDHYLHVRATDHAGNETQFTSSVYRIDVTKPTNPNIADYTDWQKSDVSVTITSGTDAHSGADKTEYRLNSGEWTTYTAPFTLTTNGTTAIQTRTIDKVGNISDVVSQDVKIDKVSPDLTINPSTTDTTHEDVILTISATDDHSGVKQIRKPDGTWVTGDSLTYNAVNNGTFMFRVEDYAGNITERSITVTNIDKTLSFVAPNVSGLQSIAIPEDATAFWTDITTPVIKDWTEGANEWRLQVSATPIEGVTLILNPIESVTRIEGAGTSPTQTHIRDPKAIDKGALQLVSANGSRGEYHVAFPSEALGVIVDPTTTRPGEFSTALSWEVVNAP